MSLFQIQSPSLQPSGVQHLRWFLLDPQRRFAGPLVNSLFLLHSWVTRWLLNQPSPLPPFCPLLAVMCSVNLQNDNQVLSVVFLVSPHHRVGESTPPSELRQTHRHLFQRSKKALEVSYRCRVIRVTGHSSAKSFLVDLTLLCRKRGVGTQFFSTLEPPVYRENYFA